MVAYLKKPKGSEGFHRIVDFLNASHSRYALTENPTIYVSHIEQFWRTANVRTLDNGEQELTATIDGKVKTVTEASVRRHLKLADDDVSITYRKTRTRIRRMGFRIPQSNVHTNVEDEAITMKMHDSLKRAATTATSLEAVQDSGIINKTPSKATPSGLSSPRSSSEGGPGCHVTMGGYSDEVTGLEGELKKTKEIYNKALITLTKRVKKLEDKNKSATARLHRRKLRLVLSDDEEDPSKQGRIIDQLDQDETINLINATQVSDQGEAYDQEEERKQSKKKQKQLAQIQMDSGYAAQVQAQLERDEARAYREEEVNLTRAEQ
nr:hypothetical protein [Tanacetum cinerariifolium]